MESIPGLRHRKTRRMLSRCLVLSHLINDCLLRKVVESHYSNLGLKRSSLRSVDICMNPMSKIRVNAKEIMGLVVVVIVSKKSAIKSTIQRRLLEVMRSKKFTTERKRWSSYQSQIFATQRLLMVAEHLPFLFPETAKKIMRRLTRRLDCFSPVSRSLKAARQTPREVCRRIRSKLHTQDLFCWRGIPQRSLKRRFQGMGVSLQHVDGLCCRSTISEQPSKRTKTLGHEIHDPEPGGSTADVRSSKYGLGSPCFQEKCPEKEIGWDSLPNDVHDNIIRRLDFKDTFRFKTLSKSCKKYIESDDFRELRGTFSEGSFTAINYYIKNKVWQCSGFDLHSKSWRALPPFSYLPPPDAELFKEYSVHGHGGLMCAEVSKLPKKGELVVFNALTREKRALPPLLYPRIPVLVHISVDSAQKSYKVIVAGSSSASDEHLSRKMEIFDSSTFKWKEASDLPGPAFGLNEHQAGVCLDGKLFFISFLEGDCRRGVVAFDMEQEKWLENLVCPIPFSSYSNTLQLVESDGKVYLFSEQERGQCVEHCIDELEFPRSETGAMECQWRNVVRVKKSGGRSLMVYPEHTCVGFGEGKLLIFNTLKRDGVVYEMRDGIQCEVLEPPPGDQIGDKFFTLNPASFIIQPSFDSDLIISEPTEC